MHDERYIQQCAKDLILEFGADAESVAQRKMQELMDKSEIKEAGLWLAVVYEIHRANSQHIH